MIERRLLRRCKPRAGVTTAAVVMTSNAAAAFETRSEAIDSSVTGH